MTLAACEIETVGPLVVLAEKLRAALTFGSLVFDSLPCVADPLDGVDAALLDDGTSPITELGGTSAADGGTEPTDAVCDALTEAQADRGGRHLSHGARRGHGRGSKPTASPPPTVASSARTRTRRRWLVPAAAAATALLVGVAAVLAFRPQQQADQTIAEAPSTTTALPAVPSCTIFTAAPSPSLSTKWRTCPSRRAPRRSLGDLEGEWPCHG
jgi:hypothetical protein